MCLAVLAALQRKLASDRWIGGIAVVVAGIALLPPFEFLGQASGDPNYRQQFALALITWVIGGIGLGNLSTQVRRFAVVAVALLGLIACTVGLAQGYILMNQFNITVQTGPGGIVMGFVFLATGTWQVRAGSQKQTRQHGERATLSPV
jgi:hypothetical protein